MGGVSRHALHAMERRLARPARGIFGRRHIRLGHRGLGRKLLQRSSQVVSMNFQLLGVNHKTAPVEVREQLAIADTKLADALRELMGISGVREAMILSTCNRVEVLAHTANGGADLRLFLREHFGVQPSSYEPHLYEYRANEAVRHVFRVASSLDSLVV